MLMYSVGILTILGSHARTMTLYREGFALVVGYTPIMCADEETPNFRKHGHGEMPRVLAQAPKQARHWSTKPQHGAYYASSSRPRVIQSLVAGTNYALVAPTFPGLVPPSPLPRSIGTWRVLLGSVAIFPKVSVPSKDVITFLKYLSLNAWAPRSKFVAEVIVLSAFRSQCQGVRVREEKIRIE